MTDNQDTATASPPSVPSPFRVLLFGIDTVYLSFDQEVSQATYERLITEQAEARSARTERNAAYCSPWLDALVYPGGAHGFGVIIDRKNEWTIKVQKGNEHRPGIYLEMRSKALHTHPGGAQAAVVEAVAWMRETLFADADPYDAAKIAVGNEKLSRYDLHLDYQGGWHPTLETGEARCFIKPARAGWAPYMSGDDCTGYTIGKKRIMARIYNKTTEAKNRHDEEYFALIQEQAGEKYDPVEDIWRVEFELKREGMTGFCIVTPPEVVADDADEIEAEMEAEDWPTISTLTKALHWTPQMWRYLTTRWLRLVVPNGDSNKARWPLHPVWQQIQEGFTQAQSTPLTEDKATLVREQRHSGKRRLINRMAAGLTTTAFLMLESDPTLAVRQFCENVEHMAQQMAAYQQTKQQRGVQRLDAVRYEQYLQHLAQLAHMASGAFAIAGVLKQHLPQVAEMPDLVLHIADELEAVAHDKGGVPQMLYDKWCKEYKVLPPRALFKRTDKFIQ